MDEIRHKQVASVGRECGVATVGCECGVASAGWECGAASAGWECGVASVGCECGVASVWCECEAGRERSVLIRVGGQRTTETLCAAALDMLWTLTEFQRSCG